jgi:hypothetical protein
MVLMCLAALSKVSAKYVLIRNLQYDDVFTVLAMVSKREDHCILKELKCINRFSPLAMELL